MANKKASSLKQALEGKQPKPDKSAAPAPAAAAPAANGTERGYRGAVISGYFDVSVQKQLRMMSVEHDKTVRDLMAEALNMLFSHYKKPAIADTSITTPAGVS